MILKIEMKNGVKKYMFSERELREAEKNNKHIGNWNNCPVYAMSKNSLEHKAKPGYYYIVYDDNNALVNKNVNGNFYVKATVTESGNVHEFNERKYELPKPLNESKEINMENRKEYAASDKLAALKRDAVAIDVDAYLEEVKGITVDDMLVGVRGANYKS